VIDVLCKFGKCVERASIDEAYIDLTMEVEERMKQIDQIEDRQLPNTFTVGWEGDEKDKAKGTVEGTNTCLDIKDGPHHPYGRKCQWC
jgi:DNA polymerase eta